MPIGNPTRGEIWQIDLEPILGSEIGKQRPCLIINPLSVGMLPCRIVVPITRWQLHLDRNPWMVTIDPTSLNGLTKKSLADTFQIRNVSTNRLVKFIGEVDADLVEEIAVAVALSVGCDFSRIR